jgi:Peptidase family C25, C terminal ig-like domain
MQVSHPPLIGDGATEFAVTVENSEAPLPHALAALYFGGHLYGSAITDSTGFALIPINQTLGGLDSLEITITARNFIPHRQSIPVMPMNDATSPLTERLSVKAFPNPCHDSISFSLGSSRSRPTQMAIHDLERRLVYQDQIMETVRWDLNNQKGLRTAPGRYFYKLEDGHSGSIIILR